MQRLIRRVSLADGFFDHLDVTVRAFADFKPMNVSHVEVQLNWREEQNLGSASEEIKPFAKPKMRCANRRLPRRQARFAQGS